MKLRINDIKNLIPHRHPFLFIDECEILEKGKIGIASRVFKHDEFFFGCKKFGYFITQMAGN